MYGTDLSVSEIFPEFQTPEIQLEYAKEEGKRVLEELGCEDMQMVDEIYDSTRYNEFKAQDEESIMLHFTRVIDGIPITYTDSRRTVNITNTAGDVSEQVDFSESFSMNFDEEGLAQIYWKNPAKIYDMSDEYVFLMPFSEIWNIFKKEAIAANTEDFAYMMQRDINISKIELGYMWLPDTSSDSDKEGTLIPVWDFLGTSSTIYDYSEGIAEEKYIDQVDLNLPNQSFLTINAMDGSIVYAPAPVF